MHHGKAEAGVGVLTTRTVRGRKPSIERHMDVLERVLVVNTAATAPLNFECRADMRKADCEFIEKWLAMDHYLAVKAFYTQIFPYAFLRLYFPLRNYTQEKRLS